MDHTPWGELEPSDEESSEEEEEEESDEEKPDETGFITPADRYSRWRSEEVEVEASGSGSQGKSVVAVCVQWAHHSGRLLISSCRHGDSRAHRAQEEEDRGGHGWVSVSSAFIATS